MLIVDSLLLTVIVPCTVFGNYCIYRTMNERMQAINAVRFRPFSGPPILKAYDAVTFNQHLLALVLVRNPWKLYDPIVLDAIKNPQTDVIGLVPGETPEPPPTVN